MRAHLKFHAFTLANIGLLAMVNLGLPLLFGLEQFGKFTISVASSYLISGLVTTFFDLSSSRTEFSYMVELVRRGVVALILFLIFVPIYSWPTLFLTLVLTISPINVLLMLQKRSKQFWLLYVSNIFITALWISQWYVSGDFILNYLLLKEMLYFSILVLLTRDYIDLRVVHKRNASINWNVLVLAFIDQSKLWIPLLLYVGSSADTGLFRIELTLSYMLVTVLPLNPVSVLATDVDRKRYLKLVLSVILSVGVVYFFFGYAENYINRLMSMLDMPTIAVRYIVVVSYLYLIFRAFSVWFLDLPLVLLLFGLFFSSLTFYIFIYNLRIAVLVFFSSFLILISLSYVWNRWMFRGV